MGIPPRKPPMTTPKFDPRVRDLAEKIYRDLLTADENNVPARLGLARVLEATNRDDEALATLATIPEIGDPGAEIVRIRRTIEMKRSARPPSCSMMSS